MKIIKEGSLPKEEVGTCKKCGCVISFLPEEAERVNCRIDPRYHGATHYKMRCPTKNCDDSIYVET